MAVETVERTVELLVRGRVDLAEEALLRLKPEEVWKVRKDRRSKTPRPPRPAPKSRKKRRSVPAALIKKVFSDCSYTCVYCGRQTIDLDVLKLLHRFCPTILPYHPNWAPKVAHALYWVYSTSVEHVDPVSQGGTNDESNLVAACYDCNDFRRDADLGELRWSVRRVSSTWLGLTEHVATLRTLADELGLERSPRAVGQPQRSSTVRGSEVRARSLIRARLPGRKSRRQYRVDSREEGQIGLTEMWREGPDRIWVASTKSISCGIEELEAI